MNERLGVPLCRKHLSQIPCWRCETHGMSDAELERYWATHSPDYSERLNYEFEKLMEGK